jgi:hypothetical protein
MGGTEMEQAEELRRKLRALGKFAVVSSIHCRFALDAHVAVHMHTWSCCCWWCLCRFVHGLGYQSRKAHAHHPKPRALP